MHTIARILTPLLLTIGLLAGAQAAASADPATPGPYDRLTRAELITALVARDATIVDLTASLDARIAAAAAHREEATYLRAALSASNDRAYRVTVLEQQVTALEQQVTDLTYRVGYYSDLARTWELEYRATYRRAVRAEQRADRLADRLAIVKAGR